MADLIRNQDFTKAFLEHPSFVNIVAHIKNTGSLAIYNPKRGIYDILSPDDAEELIYRFMLTCAKKSVSTATVSDIVEQVKWMTEKKFESTESKYLALTDALLDMETFITTQFSIDHPAFFSVPFSASTLASNNALFDQSRFKTFLEQILITDQGTPDKELITLVQEMFGYTLLPSNNVEASFFLVGEGSNGKSVLLRLLENVIGEKWCSGLSVEQMTTKDHMTTDLVGKRLNICTEEESQFVKSDKFKSLVSGEPTIINNKFGKIYRTRLNVKYIYSTNELPTFSGFNHGLIRRIKIIPFKRTFTDKEQDRQLTSKLLKELPIITAWALEGARRLVKNGYKLSLSTASNDLRADFESNLSSAVAFIREEYTEQEDAFMFYSDLYLHYTQWCVEVGKKQMSRQNFIRDISRVLKLPPSIQWNPGLGKADRGRPLIRNKDSVRIPTIQTTLPNL